MKKNTSTKSSKKLSLFIVCLEAFCIFLLYDGFTVIDKNKEAKDLREIVKEYKSQKSASNTIVYTNSNHHIK